MDPLRRKRVAEHTAELLIGEIAAGRLRGRLPSTRNLAVLLDVSRPKILEAMKVLEHKGVIRQTGPRRTYSVSDSGIEGIGRERESPGERHALFVVEENLTGHEPFELLVMLATRLQPQGWRISTLPMNCGHNEYRPLQWKRAIEGYAPQRVIVWSGRPLFARWLHESGIPALFIGGDPGDTPIPVCGMLSQHAVGTILDAFFEAGHERIWFPFCNRPEAYTQRLRSFVARAFAARGVAFSERQNTPSSPYRNPEVILAMFDEAWRGFRPTALMFHDWREYLAVSSVLRREGLDIPSHMSVALIGKDPEMSWHQPELAHFSSGSGRIAGACVAWLTSDNSPFANKKITFEGQWKPGGSIGRPRKD